MSATKHSPVVIRPFKAGDAPRVRTIFSRGMWGLWPWLWKHALLKPKGWLGFALPCASAAALYGLSPARPAPWAQAGPVLLGMGVYSAVAIGRVYKLMGDYVNHSLEDDLADIPGTYSEPGSGFWVADKEGVGVVGMVALHRRSDTEAELRRLSVAPDMRGQGIAEQLVKELLRHAKQHGFQSVFLTTSEAQQPALKLYWKLGWETTKHLDMGGIHVYHLTFYTSKSVL